jgi:hypothetical protein
VQVSTEGLLHHQDVLEGVGAIGCGSRVSG